MSGHSKWHNIQMRKGASDAKRAKTFTRLTKQIAVAAKEGGADPAINSRLRSAVETAKAASMPKENIERAIQRAVGGAEGNLEEVTYEGFGPGGVAFIIQAVTDNRNRTAAEIRNLFNKHGGSLAGAGAVKWMFETERSDGKLIFNPKQTIEPDAASRPQLEAFYEALDELDDVNDVFSNEN